MAGRSSRFFEAGFTKPKFQLELWGRPILDWVLLGFKQYFITDEFLFIALDEYDNIDFIHNRCEVLGVRNYEIVVLADVTSGQATTVFEGIQNVRLDEELFIFNADSFKINFVKAEYTHDSAGGLDVFLGEGTHWSFIEPGPMNTVVRTTEKVRISPYCSDGLYYFRTRELFELGYSLGANATLKTTGETYIAPIYNHLIEKNHPVKYREVKRA